MQAEEQGLSWERWWGEGVRIQNSHLGTVVIGKNVSEICGGHYVCEGQSFEEREVQSPPPLVRHRETEDGALVGGVAALGLLALHAVRNVEAPVEVDALDSEVSPRVVEACGHRGCEDVPAAHRHLRSPLVVAHLE